MRAGAFYYALIRGSVVFPAELSQRYECESRLGYGGFGEVFKAIDKQSNTPVAIKICVVQKEVDERTLASEADILRSLDHPHIARYYDSGMIHRAGATLSFLVEELVTGTTLQAYLEHEATLDAQHRLGLSAKIRILRQIAEALLYLHSKQIVYADLSAKNVMLDQALNVTLIDFDLAFNAAHSDATARRRLRATGTSAYMSPERILNRDAFDFRDDIYAFGILAYQLITMSLPFEAVTDVGARLHHLIADMPSASSHVASEGNAENCALPPTLEVMIGICTEKNRENRYDSFHDIIAVLTAMEASCLKKRTLLDRFASLMQKFLIRR